MSRQPWTWPGSVIVALTDADTVSALVTRRTALEVDLGFGGTAIVDHRASFTVRLRLEGIDADPAASPTGRVATARLRELVEGLVQIETRKPYKFGGPDDSPGEWMARVRNMDGVDVAQQLLVEGLVHPWNGQGVRPSSRGPVPTV